MGGCASCMRLILEAESDVKINVIEPTTIMNDGISFIMPPRQRPGSGRPQHAIEQQPATTGFLLTVPPTQTPIKKHQAD